MDNNCVNIGVSVMNVSDFVQLYLQKRSFLVTFKVPAHMYTSFSIIIWYTENISSHDNTIKTFSECKVDFSFSYMGPYKND